ncbi:MAG TPA: hypothetical protein PLD76_06735 [Paludibacteraceae bacterium]|nr:hypothetical protein [Paludibacteraceae bacterium]
MWGSFVGACKKSHLSNPRTSGKVLDNKFEKDKLIFRINDDEFWVMFFGNPQEE